MRVVFDSSVAFRLLRTRSGILWLKEAISRGSVVSVTSDYIVTEVERVLCEKGGVSRQKAKIASRVLQRASALVAPQDVPAVCRDPNDDPVLAAAFEGDAFYIVSADRDLLEMKTYQGVKIVTLAQFKAKINKKGGPA